MKAVILEKFGDSDVLRVGEVPEATVGAGELKIRISHAGLNPVDWKIRDGSLQGLLPHRFPITLGWDAVGSVVAIGHDVDDFQLGDEVYAFARTDEIHAGTYAESIVLRQSSVAKRPANISAAEAAAIPLAALTAWQGLHEVLQLKAGEAILIGAGAGGVGSFAVQFARLCGAKVIATASAHNHDYVRALGADHVIDYRDEDVVAAVRELCPNGLSAVFDGAGGKSLREGMELLQVGGRLVSIVEVPDAAGAEAKRVRAAFHFVRPSGAQLTEIARMIEQGRLRLPAIEMASIRDVAHHLDVSKQQHVRGKIVLNLDFA